MSTRTRHCVPQPSLPADAGKRLRRFPAGAVAARLQRDIGPDEIREQLVSAYLSQQDTLQRQVASSEDACEAHGRPRPAPAKRVPPDTAPPCHTP
jgi:hypothetical protein